MKFLWVCTLLASCVAALIAIFGIVSEGSAPQQAAMFALACAIAIVPYVFTRAAEGISHMSSEDSTRQIVDAIRQAKS